MSDSNMSRPLKPLSFPIALTAMICCSAAVVLGVVEFFTHGYAWVAQWLFLTAGIVCIVINWRRDRALKRARKEQLT